MRTLAKRECPESCVLKKKTKRDPSCAARRRSRVGTIISLSLDVD